MNEEISRVRTPEALGAEVRNLTAAAKYLTVYYAVEIGRRLTEAKELVAHGEWMDWLRRETELSQSGANRLMRIYAEYGQKMGLGIAAGPNSSMLNNISVSNALRLLAVPEEDRESFAEEVDAEHLSARELEEAIRERDEAKKRADALMQDVEGAELAVAAVEEERDEARAALQKLRTDAKAQRDEDADTIRTLEKKIQELESRPIDVAVQEPDPEEIERRASEIAKEAGEAAEQRIRRLETEKTAAEADKAAAEAKVKAAEDKAKAERDKLKEKLKAAEEKLEAAKQAELTEERRAEVIAPYEAEIAKLKKQINMSEAKIAAFTARFLLWQGAFKALMEALRDVPEESREKCAGAISAQLENWKGALG